MLQALGPQGPGVSPSSGLSHLVKARHRRVQPFPWFKEGFLGPAKLADGQPALKSCVGPAKAETLPWRWTGASAGRPPCVLGSAGGVWLRVPSPLLGKCRCPPLGPPILRPPSPPQARHPSREAPAGSPENRGGKPGGAARAVSPVAAQLCPPPPLRPEEAGRPRGGGGWRSSVCAPRAHSSERTPGDTRASLPCPGAQ